MILSMLMVFIPSLNKSFLVAVCHSRRPQRSHAIGSIRQQLCDAAVGIFANAWHVTVHLAPRTHSSRRLFMELLFARFIYKKSSSVRGAVIKHCSRIQHWSNEIQEHWDEGPILLLVRNLGMLDEEKFYMLAFSSLEKTLEWTWASPHTYPPTCRELTTQKSNKGVTRTKAMIKEYRASLATRAWHG